MVDLRTVEDLERLRPGAVVRVRSAEGNTTNWTREGRGFKHDTVLLDTTMFAGFVMNGMMEDLTSNEPQVGEWWADVHYFYYVMRIVGATVTVIRVRRTVEDQIEETVIQLATFSRSRMNRQEAFPADLVTPVRFMQVVSMVASAMDRVEQAQQETRVLKNRPDPVLLRPQVERLRTAVAEMDATLSSIVASVGGD